MNRRRVLLGLGGAAGAMSLAVGSAAFSFVETQREITVTITHDEDAYLRLVSKGTGGRSGMEGGQLTFSFPGDEDAVGLGSESEYWFETDAETGSRLFTVTNQGTRTVGVWGEQPIDETGDGTALPRTGILAIRDEETVPLSFHNREELGPGEKLDAGIFIDTHGIEVGEYDVPIIIHADDLVEPPRAGR